MTSSSPSYADWMERASRLRPQIHNVVAGRKAGPRGDRTIEKARPRDGLQFYSFAAGEPADVDDAVSAARHAFMHGGWAQTTPAMRRNILLRLAELVETNGCELALLECLDVGKPIGEAIAFDVPITAAILRYNAEACDKLPAMVHAASPSHLSWQLYRPLGVVGAVTGWNFPLALAAGKIGPALAAGNTMVLKPSEVTSAATARLAELALEAGVPAGVLNIVHGDGRIGDALARHMDVDLLTFTGSTATGKKILAASAQSNMKRLVLECGGKAPSIIFADAPDLEKVAAGIVTRAFTNQGQVCTASSRLLVHEAVKEELLEHVLDRLEMLEAGDPLDPSTRFGALVSQAHRDKVLGYIQAGKTDGARAIFERPASEPVAGGFYVGPVLLDEVEPGHRVAQEEIFGPVLSLLTFRDDDEAIRIANDTIYGLSAVVWTRDVARALRMAHALDVGWTVINATGSPGGGGPPGAVDKGGHKQSGFGTEGGVEGLKQYLSSTTVQVFA